MSDIIRLNIKSKNIKAIIADQADIGNNFTEYTEVLKKEKQEHSHKIELENEFKKGFEIGKSETTTILEHEHSEELLKQAQDFYKILSTFEEKIKNYENDFHRLVIKVSEKIAEKILKKELSEYSIIENVLEQNLSKIIGANEIIIKLNPEDKELIQKGSKEYLTASGITKIRFEVNDTIEKGGCLIESEIGNLDARINSQINEITKELENKLISCEIE